MNPEEKDFARVVLFMKKEASFGTWDGTESPRQIEYFKRCRKAKFGTVLIYTRDVGMHTSGWFKNPDYERCLHLSMSPAPTMIRMPGTPELNSALRDEWLRSFFGRNMHLLWAESPKTKEGKALGVWHWRLFCDKNWDPILPRGEVYSTEFTEKGWKSSSELGIAIESNLNP